MKSHAGELFHFIDDNHNGLYGAREIPAGEGKGQAFAAVNPNYAGDKALSMGDVFPGNILPSYSPSVEGGSITADFTFLSPKLTGERESLSEPDPKQFEKTLANLKKRVEGEKTEPLTPGVKILKSIPVITFSRDCSWSYKVFARKFGGAFFVRGVYDILICQVTGSKMKGV